MITPAEDEVVDLTVRVEERRWRVLVPHGVAAGLCAGITLGLEQFLISAARHEGALTPFRLVASLALGAAALQSDAPTALVMTVGAAIHFALAAIFGVLFMALLALTFQLSARAWVLGAYGLIFGFLLWEINFLAILPGLYPELTPHFGLSNQIWKGIVAYSLVYGAVLGLYTALTRPGVLADWTD